MPTERSRLPFFEEHELELAPVSELIEGEEEP